MTREDARQKIILLAKNNDVYAPAVLASMRCRTCSRRHSHAFGLSGRTKNFAHWSLQAHIRWRTSKIITFAKYYFPKVYVSLIEDRSRFVARAIDEFQCGIKHASSTKDELPTMTFLINHTSNRCIFDHAYA